MSFRSSRLAAPAALALVAAAAASSPAFAWGAMGHRLIGSVGAAALPPEIPAFLRTPDAIQQIGELSREPDRSKDAGNPHDSDLNPAHFTDIDDQGKIGGVIALTDLPPTRAAYEAALRAGGTDGFVQGYLPYSSRRAGSSSPRTSPSGGWRPGLSATPSRPSSAPGSCATGACARR
ncbi:MAG: hypothetical protein WDM85_18520 [Caulobacteraceae bacterium]